MKREEKFRGYDGGDWVYSNTLEYDPSTDTFYMLIGEDYYDDGHWVMVGRVSILKEGDDEHDMD